MGVLGMPRNFDNVLVHHFYSMMVSEGRKRLRSYGMILGVSTNQCATFYGPILPKAKVR